MNRPPTCHQLQTPLGEACYLLNAEGCLLAFGWAKQHGRMARLLEGLAGSEGALPLAPDKLAPDKSGIRSRLQRYFEGDLCALGGIKTAARGTEFQRSVWGALRTIAVGETRTYGEIAKQIGNPAAVRAVGLANGANPISVVVPCHRVIGADGSLTGFGAGVERKRWLLEHEGAAAVADAQLALPAAG